MEKLHPLKPIDSAFSVDEAEEVLCTLISDKVRF